MNETEKRLKRAEEEIEKLKREVEILTRLNEQLWQQLSMAMLQ